MKNKKNLCILCGKKPAKRNYYFCKKCDRKNIFKKIFAYKKAGIMVNPNYLKRWQK